MEFHPCRCSWRGCVVYLSLRCCFRDSGVGTWTLHILHSTVLSLSPSEVSLSLSLSRFLCIVRCPVAVREHGLQLCVTYQHPTITQSTEIKRELKMGKRRNLLDERHDREDRRGDRSSRSVLKKVKILVHLQLQLTSLCTTVVSLETWILKIMVWSIITWEHGSHCLAWYRTTCFTYMSDWTSEGVELRGYMWGCIHHTESQRIRTVTKFVGPSAGHSESVFCSSVTKVAVFIWFQVSHSLLTTTTETLCLSITGEKYTVGSRQHMVTSVKLEMSKHGKYAEHNSSKVETGWTKHVEHDGTVIFSFLPCTCPLTISLSHTHGVLEKYRL